MTRQPCSSEMEVTDLEPTADLDPTSELKPADDDGEQSMLLDINAAVTEAASQVATGQVELGVVLVGGDIPCSLLLTLLSPLETVHPTGCRDQSNV